MSFAKGSLGYYFFNSNFIIINSSMRLNIMSKHTFILTIIITTALILSGCSNIKPYTNELRNSYELTDDEIQRIQFYLKGKIVLEREVKSTEKKITPVNTLKRIKGKLIEQIVFKSRTPGISKGYGSDNNHINMNFEPENYLVFNPKKMYLKKDSRYYLFSQGDREVDYEGKKYKAKEKNVLTNKDLLIICPTFPIWVALYCVLAPFDRWDVVNSIFIYDSLDTYLLVDEKTIEKIVKERRKVGGIKLPVK